jgi:hypothetical protein
MTHSKSRDLNEMQRQEQHSRSRAVEQHVATPEDRDPSSVDNLQQKTRSTRGAASDADRAKISQKNDLP